MIYRQSDKTGFRRWWISFRMAAFIAAVSAGLTSNPVGASETYIPNNAPKTFIERVVGDLRGGFRTTVVSRINEDPGLVRAAEKACQNKKVQKDINKLQEELAKGNKQPGIKPKPKPICKGVTEHRGHNDGRLYTREVNGVIEIVGKSGKRKINQDSVIKRLTEIYG